MTDEQTELLKAILAELQKTNKRLEKLDVISMNVDVLASR